VSNDAADALDINAAMLGLGNEITATPYARIVRNRALPNIYAANHLTAVTASTGQEIDDLMKCAESEFAHSNHLRFYLDFRTPPAVWARLALEGYEREDVLVFILDGDLKQHARRMDIRAISSDADWEAFWNLMRLDWAESHQRKNEPSDEGVALRMFEATRMKQPPMQYWLAYISGEPVAYLGSWGGVGGVGQVEDLFTHPAHRHQGIATSLIHHCVEQSRSAGASRVVITAEVADTPKQMYAALGFRPVAILATYLRRSH
jgi:GNAT superfamily N-acetyltransferase